MKQTILAVMFGLVTSGCGVGYKLGTQTHTFNVDSNGSKILPSDREIEVGMAYHEFRILDTTGLLMAGLVNSSRQYLARQEALESGQYKPDTNNDGKVEVEYSYKPYGIYPGSRVIADLRLSAGTPELKVDGTAAGASVDYYGLDVLGEFASSEIGWLPGARVGYFFAARIDNFDYAETSDPISFSSLPIDVTFGTALGYSPIQNLILTGSGEIGWVSPLLKLLIDDPDIYYFNGLLKFEATYYALNWLGVSADATLGQLNDGSRTDNFGRVGLGLIAEFGNAD